ncbi:hypothetical protein DFA_00758 [Cavenderia fasciculata]|uniref:DUF4050 domain-containing protein n=1 Tax=Cavenderia fasciculata TaxID=261658 RepID=F4PTL1_CACFS|nr:uncharacterized protein DFA_00758 [Cavenderia fasciculata]EGG20893.1 hypothetical protein DFA_00758 [Cavenderia fasciculata]|eukprot:XP_004358743.1 hypothetical protein DFA_00758 [Cavenderia fasciculata]
MNDEWRSGVYNKQPEEKENIRRSPPEPQPLQLKSIDAMKVTDELINKNGVFSSRVPLADLISILVEEWETEEMMDAH